jgi:hypothetical protein
MVVDTRHSIPVTNPLLYPKHSKTPPKSYTVDEIAKQLAAEIEEEMKQLQIDFNTSAMAQARSNEETHG